MLFGRVTLSFAAVPVAIALSTASGAATTYAPGYGPCSIVVTVRDRAGQPVPGAVVDAIGPANRSVATSAAGVASFIAIPAGNYVVRARTNDAVSGAENVAVTPALAGGRPATRGGTPVALGVVALSLQPNDVGGALEDASVGVTSIAPAARTPAFDLAREEFADVTGLGASGGVRIAGGDARSAGERLDGVPLPDALRGSLVLPGAPALVRNEALARGAESLGERPGDGTGGILSLATAPLGARTNLDAALGAGVRGAESSVAADVRLGPLVTGLRFGDASGSATARRLAARFALSPSTRIDAQSYRLDDRDGLPSGPFTVTANAAGISTSLGMARLGVSTYDSAFSSTGAGVDDRLGGFSLRYDGTLGPAGIDLSYARDAERAVYAGAPTAASDLSRLALRSEYVLSPAVRGEATVTQSRGTLVPLRRDVATTLAVDLAPNWVARLGTRSGFAPAPLDLVASAPFAAIAAPSTTFEETATLTRSERGATLAFEAFRSRESDRFAALSDADVRGLTAAYTATRARGLGFDFASTVASVRDFGSATPERDATTTALASALGLDGDSAIAAFRGRAGLTYAGRSGFGAGIGATYLDAPNALAPSALVLGDLSLSVPLGRADSPLVLALRAHDVLGGAFARDALAAASRDTGRRDVELLLERRRR